MIVESFPVGYLSCNCTILGTEEGGEAIVADPGGDAPKILETLARHRLTVRSIVHTHAHIDHLGTTLFLGSIGRRRSETTPSSTEARRADAVPPASPTPA